MSWEEHLGATTGDVDGLYPTITAVIGRVASEAGLTIEQLRRHDRRPRIARVRGRAARLARSKGFTYQEIGDALNRDPSSIVYLCRDRRRPEPPRKATFTMPPSKKSGRCAAVGL